MRALIFILLCFALQNLKADSTTVTVFEQNYIHFGGTPQNDTTVFSELDNGRVLSRTLTLPQFEKPVKIIANLDVDSDGDPWDRAGTIYLNVSEDKNLELLKFITGFGGHSILDQDISFLAPMLQGEVTISAFVDTWVAKGWVFDFSLKFVEIDSLQQSEWNFSALYNQGLTKEQLEEGTPTAMVNIPPSNERVMLTYYVSGHCTDGQGADEFVSKDNIISIDNTEIHRYMPWRDDCRNFRDRNPTSAKWEGDVWSSDLDRSGWCPGDIVYPVILDVTDKMASGPHTIKYWIDDIRPKGTDGNYGYWRVSSFLTGWGDISNWIPSKILLTGPSEPDFPTDAVIDLRVDLVDESGYTIFNTDQTVEFSADSSAALFSIDEVNWSNPLLVDINLGTANIWFKSPVEGEITISARDADSDPSMQSADDLVISIEKAVTQAGNYALKFDGDNDYINCGNDSSLQIAGNQITLEAWIYASQWADNVWEACILNKEQNGANNDNGYMLRCGNNGTFNFNLGSGSWNEINTSSGAMNTNRWYHVAATYDGSQMKSYINGKQVASSIKNIAIKNASANLLIGSSQNYRDRTFNGFIDEVRIWNIARTQAQLESTMNDTLSHIYYDSPDSGLAGYWSFNENEGQFAFDKSVNANHARLGTSADSDDSDPLWIESGSLVDVSEEEDDIPAFYKLTQNYPNPFNNETVFKVYLPNVAKVHAVIFNSNGELVRHIVNGQLPKGEHTMMWDSKNQRGEYTSSGVYFLNVRFTEGNGNSFVKSLKMIYLK